MPQTTFDRLKEHFKFTLMLIFDERSMLSAPVLGAVERNCRQLMHNGMNHNQIFGFVPIILLFGDDHQLPSINKFGNGKGATWIFDDNLKRINHTSGRNTKSRLMERRGFDHFISLAENVIEFRTTHRIQQGQTELNAILKNMTTNGRVTDTQARILMDRHLGSSGNITQLRKQWLDENATWIMPTNEQVLEKNFSKMQQLVTKENPICNILAKTLQTDTNTIGGTRKNHFLPEDRQQMSTHCSLCRNSKNALDRNLFAEHGLYNGAPVTPIEPRFKPGENPNTGHVPLYILSYCPTYTGPPWSQENPKWVPIPMVQKLCRYRCCQIRQAPL